MWPQTQDARMKANPVLVRNNDQRGRPVDGARSSIGRVLDAAPTTISPASKAVPK